MKSKAYYTPEQFGIKIMMKDEVWDDMDNEMLDKVTQFENHLKNEAWKMFVEFLNMPTSYLKEENPYIRPVK